MSYNPFRETTETARANAAAIAAAGQPTAQAADLLPYLKSANAHAAALDAEYVDVQLRRLGRIEAALAEETRAKRYIALIEAGFSPEDAAKKAESETKQGN